MMTIYKWDSPALKQIWQKLYADNPYLFPYSSWEYNEQIYKYMKVKPSSMFQKNFFCVYEEEKKPLVLFPLYLKKNKLGRLQVQIEQDLSSNYISGIHLIKKSVEQFIRSVVA